MHIRKMADVQFGNIGNINKDSAYRSSFLNMKDGTVYADNYGSYKKAGIIPTFLKARAAIAEAINAGKTDHFSPELKALTTDTGAGSTDKVMIPIFVDNKIVDLTRKQTPLVGIIPRVSNLGITADFNQITAKGAADFEIEGAPLSETDNIVARKSEPIKYLYSIGRTTGPAQAAQPGYTIKGFEPQAVGLLGVGSFLDAPAPNADSFNTVTHARAMREKEEDTILNGDKTTNPKEFSGIIKQMGTINSVDLASSAIALADVNASVKLAFDDGGLPNWGVTNSSTFTELQDLLAAKIGFLQAAVNTEFGFSTIKFNTIVGEINILPSRFMTTVSGSKDMFFLDMSVWEMRVLQDMTFERLAKVDDSNKFMLKLYEVLICRALQFNSSILNGA